MNDNKRYHNKLKSLAIKGIPIGVEDLAELKKDPSILIDRGYKYIDHLEYESALKIFTIGVSLDDTDSEILNGLGIALCELGEYEKSKLVLMRAVRLYPDDGIAMANLAGVLWELNETDQAIYYYTKSLGLHPDFEDVYFNLINLFLETGSLYMSYITCLELLQKYPGNIEARELMEDIIINLAITLY